MLRGDSHRNRGLAKRRDHFHTSDGDAMSQVPERARRGPRSCPQSLGVNAPSLGASDVDRRRAQQLHLGSALVRDQLVELGSDNANFAWRSCGHHVPREAWNRASDGRHGAWPALATALRLRALCSGSRVICPSPASPSGRFGDIDRAFWGHSTRFFLLRVLLPRSIQSGPVPFWRGGIIDGGRTSRA